MPRALVKVQLTKTPISGRPIGLRLRAAQWNEGHPIFGPSFNKPYSICEWSDHSTMTAPLVHKLERFLIHRGWTIERNGALITRVMQRGSLHYLDVNPDDPEETESKLIERVESSVESLTREEKLELVKLLTAGA